MKNLRIEHTSFLNISEFDDFNEEIIDVDRDDKTKRRRQRFRRQIEQNANLRNAKRITYQWNNFPTTSHYKAILKIKENGDDVVNVLKEEILNGTLTSFIINDLERGDELIFEVQALNADQSVRDNLVRNASYANGVARSDIVLLRANRGIELSKEAIQDNTNFARAGWIAFEAGTYILANTEIVLNDPIQHHIYDLQALMGVIHNPIDFMDHLQNLPLILPDANSFRTVEWEVR